VHDGLGECAVRGRIVLQYLHQATVRVTAQLHHRVDDQVRGQPASIERHAHRVHQERHVVGGNLDDAVRRLPSMLLELGVVDAQPGRSRRARAQKAPMCEGRPVQVGHVVFRQILVGGAGEVVADERLDHAALIRRHVPAHLGEHGIDQLPGVARLPGHGVPLPGYGQLQAPW
jgi:hypothetical protein